MTHSQPLTSSSFDNDERHMMTYWPTSEASHSWSCDKLFWQFLSWLKSSLSYCTSTNTHTHSRLTALFPGLPGRAGTRKVKPIWILLKQRQWVAMASAGPYASLHLAPDRQPHQHPNHSVFTGRMPFLPPNQQCQSTNCTNTRSIKQFSTVHYKNPLQTLTLTNVKCLQTFLDCMVLNNICL